MKRNTLAAIFLASSMIVQAQSQQLAKWFFTPNEVDFRKPTPTVSGALPGAPTPYTYEKPNNCWYEDGNLLFYVLDDGYIYKGNHTAIGRVDQSNTNYDPMNGEIGIFPHSDNFKNLCTKKFWIFTNFKTPSSSAQGSKYITLLDLSPGATTPISVYFTGQSYDDHNPIAIGKMRANGDRFIYMVSGAYTTNLEVYKYDGVSGSISGVSVLSELVTGEMELNNLSNRLAYVNQNTKNIEVTWLNATTGLPFSNVSLPKIIIPGYAISGLEFDKSGSYLYYSEAGGSNPGVFVRHLPSGNTTQIAGLSGYSQLEKSYSDATTTAYIICAAGGYLSRIDMATNTVDPSWNPLYTGALLPDQIDGEDMDSKLFKVEPLASYKAMCATSGSFPVKFRVHPYIVQYYSSLYKLERQELQNYNPAMVVLNSTSVALSQTSYTFNITSTRSFRFRLSEIANPNNCPQQKSFSLYVIPCTTVVLNPHTPPGSARLTATPANPAEEHAMGAKGNWSVMELDKETGFPLYNISNPDCWQTASGTTEFPGFDAVDQDYATNPDDFDCTVNSQGHFLYGREYCIVRSVSVNGMDPEYYENIIQMDEGSSPELVKPDQGNAGDPTLAGNKGASAKSLATNSANGLTMYPNPTTGALQIETGNTKSGTIEVYDLVGNKVQEAPVSGAQVTAIDLSALSKGIYMIRIGSGSNARMQKLILN